MPNAATTQSSSACETTGAPIALAYGYVWATGKRQAYFTLQETGTDALDYTRVGFWLLGEGEWDGCQELWINDQLAWAAGDGNYNNTWMGWDWQVARDYPGQDICFHFHSGCDAVAGTGLAPASVGPDQGVDTMWSVFPPAVQPLPYSRTAYFGLMRKQPILWQQNNHQNDPSQWTDINPIGLWRGLRCRLFDAEGNMVGYAFTRNPVWHWVDVTLRSELFPDYNLVYQGGPDPLPAAVSARFNWSKIYASAQYCDAVLSNGAPRFSFDTGFASATTAQAVKAQLLLCCRGFEQESQGMIAPIVDQPRPSVFTFSRNHVLPGTFEGNDAIVHTSGNRYLAKFRDILVPACNTILSISNPEQADPTVTTDAIPVTGTAQPHPFQQGDRIAIGGTGTVFDGNWTVSTVPDIENPGTPEEIDPTAFTISRKGANYPASVGAVGACGLLYSRFKERTPIFDHHVNQLARGAFALNLARRRNWVKESLDFATSTYDQVSRLARYERDRRLGFDVTPYITPPRVTLKTSIFAKDVNGALAAAIETGDHVTLDNTLNYPYAGEYEVVDPLVKTPLICEIEGSNGSLSRAPDSNSGEIELHLQRYDEAYMYDTSDPDQAGWPSVPGSYPGNDNSFASVPLANGGKFVFFTGQLPTGSQFQLPSTGFPPENLMAWASPAGSLISYHSATQIVQCAVNGVRQLVLTYADAEGNSWGGDVNFAALTWLSPDVTNTDANGMTWLPLTLLGGEEILFGQGILPDGATVELPAGWDSFGHFATAYIQSTANGGDSQIMYLAGAWVDADLGVHCRMADHSGDQWAGSAAVLIFAWKNNMGTVTTEGEGSAGWLTFPLSDGSIFGVGRATVMTDGSTLWVPAAAGDQSTLEAMLGPSNDFYTSSGGHAQGVGSCYLDQDDVVHCTFGDGSGDTWAGAADVFATYAMASASAIPVLVSVTPPSATMTQAATMTFSARVSGNTNQSVTWSVDGIAGGNASVGTIDAGGNYIAPTASGAHTITATSVAAPTASGSVAVTVSGGTSLNLSIVEQALIVSGGVSSLLLAQGDWQLTGGLITLEAASSPPTGAYDVTVSWSGVTAVLADGTVLNYTDGSSTMMSNQSGIVAIYDPSDVGGNLVELYVGSAPPTGAEVLLDISSVPALGATQNFEI